MLIIVPTFSSELCVWEVERKRDRERASESKRERARR